MLIRGCFFVYFMAIANQRISCYIFLSEHIGENVICTKEEWSLAGGKKSKFVCVVTQAVKDNDCIIGTETQLS